MDFEAARLLPVLAISEGPPEFRIKVPAQPPSCQDQEQDQDPRRKTARCWHGRRGGIQEGGLTRWLARQKIDGEQGKAGVRRMARCGAMKAVGAVGETRDRQIDKRELDSLLAGQT